MNKLFFATILSLVVSQTKAQQNEWESPCYEKERATFYSPQPYAIKRFPKKTTVSIEIQKYHYGNNIINCQFRYSGKITYETGILPINDSLGVKLSLAKTSIHNENRYLYALTIYEKKNNCWRSMSGFTNYSEVWSKEIPLTGGGVGNDGDKIYFRYLNGLLRFD